MRHLGTAEDARTALDVHQFLTGHGIECRVDRREDAAFALWIVDDSQYEAAVELLKKYQEHLEAEAASMPQGVSPKQRMREAPLTMALIAISVVVTALLSFNIQPRFVESLFFDRASILSGHVWRLVTPIFLHAPIFQDIGVLHIAFNMFWLYELGWMIERRFGSVYFGFLVIVTTVVSNVAQFYWDGPDFGGMSGVIYALFGFIWMRAKYDPAPYFTLNRAVVINIIAWLFICMTGVVGPIANAAHTGGLLAGMAWGLIARVGFRKPAEQ